ncbi:DUF1294 domain-containing protein [Humisphaera borealis]|uniref:DUF1294 domain-containing protein n=1 Tax=Humisphaera borealis TaxID=2807512 RepID=A0A7M2WUF6_9BACT|nr:DUF1294 domain-containing protein [Humisphaera borealis]QOV89138.1 DUF1294 domain-containing protein [Humisphaera borealis]
MPRNLARSARVSPYRLFYVIGGLLTALLACTAYWGARWHGVWAYLAAINVTTLLLYGFDKRQASTGGLRVPEKVLHTHAFVGGTPGAFCGQRLFRHKTIKGSFQRLFWGIFGLQLLLIAAWIYLSRH